MEKKFIQCSLEVSFQSQRNYQKFQNYSKNILLLYTFTLRYSLASRAFP